MADMFKAACIETLKNDELIERLREEKYDVMMAESFDMCGIGAAIYIFAHKYINERLECRPYIHLGKISLKLTRFFQTI